MRRMVALLTWFALAPAFGATQGATATSANYEVEVLAFEIQMPEFEGSELWTRGARAADAGAMAVESLPTSSDFAAMIAAMNKDGRYRVLLHKHWSQSAESKSDGPAVQLLGADGQLSGTLKFYLARFLHLELNVSYQANPGAIGAVPASDSGLSYVINEQRRVKSNELNYFDHPKFGVLVRVTPVAG